MRSSELSWLGSWCLTPLLSVGQIPTLRPGAWRSPGLKFLLSGVVSLLVLLPSPPPAGAASPTAESSFEERVLEVIRNHPAAIVDALDRFEEQQQQEQRQKQASLLRSLFPVPAQIIGSSPMRGRQTGTLLVEFSDFQCPYCAQAHRTLEALLAQEGKSLNLVYKHLPLSQIHPQALPAARAAWAAGRQGKFWPFHDALFNNQTRLGYDLYNEIAKNLGLDLTIFNRDRQGEASLQAIRQDLALAERLKLQGTPTFLIQRGSSLEVISLPELQAGVEAQAKAP